MKRWIKIASITLGSLLALIIAIVSLACYLIFTPARLTGIVNKVAAQYLTCEMQVGEIDLTLFSSFPNVSLLLRDVALVNPCGSEINDTVAAIQHCEAVLDIEDLVNNNTITLRRLHLNGGVANLYIKEDGSTNFMVFAMDSTVVEDTTSTDFAIPNIDIQEITFNDIDVVYRDEMAGLNTAIKGCNLSLNGKWEEQDLKAAFQGSLNQITAQLEGESPIDVTINDLSVGINGNMKGNDGKADGAVRVGSMAIAMPDIDATLSSTEWVFDGNIKEQHLIANTSLTTLPIQVSMEGESPIKTTLAGANFTAKAEANGNTISLDPTLALDGLSVWMDKEQMLKQARITMQLPLSTDTTLSRVSFSDAKLGLNEYLVKLNGLVQIQDTANINAALQFETGRWDIPSLLTLVPESYRYLLEDIKIKGSTALKGSINGGMKQGEPALDKTEATLALNNIDLHYTDSIALQSGSASLALNYSGQNDRATGTLNASNLDATMTGLADAHLEAIKGNFTVKRAMRIADGYIDAQAQLSANNLVAAMDTLGLNVSRPTIDLTMKAKSSTDAPQFYATLHSDTLNAKMGSLVAASTGALKISGEARYNDSATDVLAQWTPQMTFDLQSGHIASEMITLPIDVPHILFDYADGRFTINDSRILLGNSDFALRGDVTNIDSFINETGLLKAELDFTSSYTDVTELMNLVSGLGVADSITTPQPEEEPLPTTATTEETDPFMVPLGFDVRLNTDIQAANVNGFTFEDIGGHVTVRDGVLVLEEMGFTSDAARMQLTAMYKSPRKDHLFVGFDFHLLDIEIDQLIRMIPDVDSIIPMLSAFDGEAQFHLAAETYLHSNYDPKFSTLRAAGAIEGKDLVVMDNDTYRQISKLLMFEKKTENKVDSINVELAVFRDKVTLYPFLIAMDDYKAVIGGRHNIDNDLSFNYHISLTDCPLPVRLGLDVSGTLDDMSFKLVPCKYAHLYNPEKQNVVQERTLQLKKIISDALKANIKEQPARKE